MYKHILVPTDGSKLSQQAAQAAIALAAKLGARITAFFAAPPATPILFKQLLPVGYATPAQHARMIKRAAEDYLGGIEKAARDAGVPCQSASATSDYPADAILAVARKHRCDLIFIASHGRRGLRHDSLLGSETHKVLARSPIPVLVYRAGRG